LPPHNDQQVDFAFTVYNTQSREGAVLARKFKRIFSYAYSVILSSFADFPCSVPVKIDFLGVWYISFLVSIARPFRLRTDSFRDTVSSVGIVPRSLPYSSQNDGVKIFRHALALDECRARFRPNIWGEPAVVREELDDDPDIPQRGETPRDEWVYQPPALTDVKEVWFAGENE